MATLAAHRVPCTCPAPPHLPTCRWSWVDAERGQLYGGLYGERRDGDAPARGKVRLLNPSFTDEDATSRRFAQLEID